MTEQIKKPAAKSGKSKKANIKATRQAKAAAKAAKQQTTREPVDEP
ncbi:hypothetical protein [Nonomuraea longicatena]|jgi:hypothetical protein|uniref:Uncharacterized protein n=1 Tax=Nonomuraea longicatena TaxID=83682 RepID=A0ABN1PZK4_9ACTN